MNRLLSCERGVLDEDPRDSVADATGAKLSCRPRGDRHRLRDDVLEAACQIEVDRCVRLRF